MSSFLSYIFLLQVRSQTGSGKTLAYAVPILNALQSINPKLQRGDGVQAVIIVPTRELALQTDELFGKINVSIQVPQVSSLARALHL